MAKINEARASLNLPLLNGLPDGLKANPHQCPLAHALGGMVGVDGICFNDPETALQVASAWHTPIRSATSDRYIVTLPDTLQHFVRDFDLGAYRLFA